MYIVIGKSKIHCQVNYVLMYNELELSSYNPRPSSYQAVWALRILAPYQQKRKRIRCLQHYNVSVFVDKGSKYVVPKLPIMK